MKMKKILALFMAIAMILGTMVFNVSADEFESGATFADGTTKKWVELIESEDVKFGYEGYEGYEDVLTYVNPEITDIVIDGSVRVIGTAFQDNTTIESIIINEGVEEIGAKAMYVNPNKQTDDEGNEYYLESKLTEIVMPESLTTIGRAAFCNTAVETVTIYANKTYSGNSHYSSCNKLKKVIIEEGVATIPEKMFEACYELEELVIPRTVTSVGRRAVYDCLSLNKLVVLSDDLELGAEAFGKNNIYTPEYGNCELDVYVVNEDLKAKMESLGTGLFSNADSATTTTMKLASITSSDGSVECYDDLQSALKALKAGDTLDIYSDITITEDWDERKTGGRIEVPVTIDGNGKTITFNCSIKDDNYHAPFRFTADATVKDWTIDVSNATNGTYSFLRAISAGGCNLTVENCNFVGNPEKNSRAIVFAENTTGNNLSVSESTFDGWGRAITVNENGRDAAEVAITESVFENSGVMQIYATDKVTFSGNTLEDTWVQIDAFTSDENLSVTAEENVLEQDVNLENNQYNAIMAGADIEAQGEFLRPVAQVDEKLYVDLRMAIEDAAELGETVTVLADVELSDTVQAGTSRTSVANIYIKQGQTVVLDLAGHTVKGVSGNTIDGGNYYVILNWGNLTINDSVGGGVLENVAGVTTAGRMSNTIENYSALIINGGTIRNQAKGDNAFNPYVIDQISGDITNGGGQNASLTLNGGNIVSGSGNCEDTDYVAVYMADYGGQLNNTVTVTDGTISGRYGIYMGTITGDATLTISGGEISGGNGGALTINDSVAVTDDKTVVSVTGGKINGAINVKNNIVTKFLSGGSYTVKPDEALLADGFAVGAISNGIYEVIEPIVLKYIPTKKDGKTVEGAWDIVIDAGLDRNIFEFVGAELVLSNDASRVEGGFNEDRMNYNIYGVDGKTSAGLNFGSALNNPDTYTQVYRINTIGKERLSGRDVVIGTIVFDGKGTPDIALLEGSTVVLTKGGTHDEAYYTTTEGTLSEVDFETVASSTTKRDVKVNIEFEHDIEAGVSDNYKFMTVTLKDSIGNTFTKELGDIKITGVNSGEIIFDDVTIGVITVTLKAPGFRTYTYQTTMEDTEEEFVLNFWNSVLRDKKAFIEAGNTRSEMAHNFLVGDIAMDYIIDKYDLAAVTSYYGIYDIDDSNDAKYIEKHVKYDLNRDGQIDILDVAYVLHGMGN